jgi:hypothetical protein
VAADLPHADGLRDDEVPRLRCRRDLRCPRCHPVRVFVDKAARNDIDKRDVPRCVVADGSAGTCDLCGSIAVCLSLLRRFRRPLFGLAVTDQVALRGIGTDGGGDELPVIGIALWLFVRLGASEIAVTGCAHHLEPDAVRLGGGKDFCARPERPLSAGAPCLRGLHLLRRRRGTAVDDVVTRHRVGADRPRYHPQLSSVPLPASTAAARNPETEPNSYGALRVSTSRG